MAYAGQIVKIPLGDFGIITDKAPGDLPPGALINARNIVVNNGTVQKAPGSYIHNPDHQLDGSIVAMFDWFPSPGVQRLIAATSTGKIYRDTDRTFALATPIATGLPALNPRSMFIEAGNETAGRDKKLFLFTDSVAQLQVLAGDGSTVADITLPASDWETSNYPRVGIAHRNRLWAFSGQRAYASNTGDHEDFQNSILTQSVFPGEGGEIIGATVYKGRLFAWKEGDFIYYLDDSNGTSANWFWRQVSSSFGLASPNSIVAALDDLFSGNSTGSVTSYKAVEAFGDIESGDLFRMAGMERYLRATTHPKGVEYMHAIYDQELKQLYFTYRSTYRNDNDMLINVDMNRQSPRITYLQKGSPTSLALRKNKNGIQGPIYGNASGYVHVMNYEDRLEGGVAYEGSFQTSFLDFDYALPGMGAQNKQFDFVWVEYVPEGDVSLNIDVFIDGKFYETVTTKLELANEELDSFALDTNRLSQYTTVTNPIPIHGMGRRISFRCYNSGSNESFQIANIDVGFRPTEHGATKY